MILIRLRQQNFRNLASLELVLPPGPLALVGPNASGKTNLLEAIFLALGGEVRGALADRVRFGAAEARLFAEVETQLGAVRFEQRFGRGGREIRLNEAPASLRELAEYAGAVWIRPEDIALVRGGPEERRRWLDQALMRFSPRYRALLSAYEKTLRQRNAALKTRPHGLGVWNERLAGYGEQVLHWRRRILERLAPLAAAAYRELDAAPLVLELRETAPPERLAELLEANLQEELERGVTLAGPHRDDVRLLLDGRDAVKFASRGEARSVALAMRLAEHRLLAEHHGEPPLLLVDDFSAELDARRQAALLAYATGLPQAVLSGTHAPEGWSRTLRIEAGVWNLEG
ncbi:DNA replication/repair protein RecF [Oceanithermus sp.]